MYEIFVSYRRGDRDAEVIRDFLERNLYRGVAYYDVYDLTAGDFRKELAARIRTARVVVLVVGRVFELRTGDLANGADVVRREIETALAAGVPVVPVLTSNRRPEELTLPDELRNLSFQNALTLSARDLKELRVELPRLLPLITPHLTEYWRRQDRWHRRLWRAAAATATVLFAGLIALFTTGADAAVHHWFVHRMTLAGDLQPEVKHASKFFDKQPLAPANQAQQDRNDLDGWIVQLHNQIEPPKVDPKSPQPASERHRLFMLTRSIPQNARACVLKASYRSEYQFLRVYAFLKSNPGEPHHYRPVYRQLKVSDESYPPAGKPYRLITVPDVNGGEEVLLLLMAGWREQQDVLSTDPSALGLQLEVY